MTIEERQVYIDEIVGMIKNYFYEKDIDMKEDVTTQIVLRAASEWLAEYAACPERDAEIRNSICDDLGHELSILIWANSCLIDERRLGHDAG